MENKNYIHISSVSSLTKSSNIETVTPTISFIISPRSNLTTSLLDNKNANKTFPDNLAIIQPTIKYI